MIESLASGYCSQNQGPLLSPEELEEQTFNHTAEDLFKHFFYWTLLKAVFMACLHTYETQEIPRVSGGLAMN